MGDFDDLFAEVTAGGTGFGHRQHVQLTFLAIRRHGLARARSLVGQGIQDTARAAGVPGKFHATVTEAWLLLVAHHEAGSFDELVEQHPDLLDKDLLRRFYSPEVLASGRAAFVEPDLAPLPRPS